VKATDFSLALGGEKHIGPGHLADLSILN